ncbi:transcriptional regulator [Gallibacterium genomosp. 3]|uniref:Transcriptional regulator n=1 Tax=Gallibacterium genomosp. 3 TaxID=505345 RepID=A0A1A7PR61_9PAST|nr:helix-turn-helix transcriptional regulator [Gallibacterium genomosp. 3]OBX04212.1 transcriptional regulator [Gallibacterium genomosp. 3]
MKLNQKIRILREQNLLTQEEMADKMNMSLNGYARIERGETKLHLDKLEKIAKIFDMDIIELITTDNNNIFLINENSQLSSNYYNNSPNIENEKLKLIIIHKDELLKQKEKEIQKLEEIIALLKDKLVQ